MIAAGPTAGGVGAGGADEGGSGQGHRELTISGGGSTLVATDTVFAELAVLRRVQGEAEEWEGWIERVRSLGLGESVSWQPSGLGACVLGARVAIRGVADESRQLADSLADAAERYGHAEDGLDALLRGTGSWLGYTGGQLARWAPLLGLSMAAPLFYTAVGSLVWNRMLGRAPSVLPPLLADWVRENPRLLSDPTTVRLVRVLVSSADDAALGGFGVPIPVAVAVGEYGAGLLGPESSAFGLLAVARAVGLLRETPVRVRRTGASVGSGVQSGGSGRPGAPGGVGGPGGTGGPGGVASGPLAVPLRGPAAGGSPGLLTVPQRMPARPPQQSPTSASRTGAETTLEPPLPPTGFADLADRIPTREDGGQVRIERYGDAEHPRWVLYLGGTVEWDPAGSTEPWDMTSNVTAVADQEAGSYRAVLQVLEAAGVQPGDPVVPVAHSQGGLLANQLISRGDLNAVGLVTFGAPETDLPLPEGLPAIAIEHDDDIIPALGATSEEDSRLYVRTERFAGREVPAGEPLPAHQLVGYRETARLVDESPEPRLVAFRAQLDDMVGTAPGEQSVWHAQRVD